MADMRLVLCNECHGDGRIYGNCHPNDPDPPSEPCPVCNGTAMILIDVEPVTLVDLEEMG